VDRKQDLLSDLARLLASIDEESYAAMASRGLLRRARKDIEKQLPIALAEIEQEEAIFTVGDQTVAIPASGPAGARCSCPASGTCQHILAACLRASELIGTPTEQPVEYGNEQPEEGDGGPACWLAVDSKALRAWCGAGSYRKAGRLTLDHAPEIAEGQLITVRFNTGIECHLLPNGDLDSCISSAAPRLHRTYVVAAVLALQRLHDCAPDLEGETRPAVDGGLLSSIQELVEELVEVGLQHVSKGAVARLQVLATLCRGAKLYRPALELESCAKDLDWLIERNAQASTDRLVGRFARLYALAESLQQTGSLTNPELTGVGRSRFLERGALELVGLGAYPWDTESGYHGLTTIYWSPREKTCFSWGDVRTRDSADGFDPILRVEGAGPWSSATSLRDLSTSAFTLHGPHVNTQRRLGDRASFRVREQRPITASDLESAAEITFTNWSALREAQRAYRGIGLARSVPLDAVVLVRPTRWGRRHFHEISQTFEMEILDEVGDSLNLAFSFRPLTERAIAYLESFKPVASSTFLVALYRVRPVEHLWSVALFDPTASGGVETSCFHFSTGKKKKWQVPPTLAKHVRSRLPARWLPVPDETREDPLDSEVGELEQYLTPLQATMLECAERGNHRKMGNDGENWASHALHLEHQGLLRLSRAVQTIGETTPWVARRLLAARYLTMLHVEAE